MSHAHKCQCATLRGYLCGQMATARYRRTGTRDQRWRNICGPHLTGILARAKPNEKIEVQQFEDTA